MLERSVYVGAWHTDQLVGFARAVTDTVYRAFIEDVVVDIKYRHQGIGQVLVETLLQGLAVEEVTLFCEPELVGFYEQFTFEPVSTRALHIWRG